MFYRTNAQTRALEEIFIRSAIPYRMLGGTKFYERAEIKDAMAYLIAVANPADDLALRRIMNTPKRGIGPATEAALQAHADSNGSTLRDALPRCRSARPRPEGHRRRSSHFAAILDEATLMRGRRRRVRRHPHRRCLEQRTGYIDALRASRDPQDEARAENVEELVAVTQGVRSATTPRARSSTSSPRSSLVAAADELDDSSGTVSLMTLHTAKGLEYEAVFLTGIEEDLLPHRMSAASRAAPPRSAGCSTWASRAPSKRLYLSLAMTRAQFGDISVAMPSRTCKRSRRS